MKYYLIKCNKCMLWRVCIITDLKKYFFKCTYCGGRKKLKSKNSPYLSLNVYRDSFYDGIIAGRVCAELNKKLREK